MRSRYSEGAVNTSHHGSADGEVRADDVDDGANVGDGTPFSINDCIKSALALTKLSMSEANVLTTWFAHAICQVFIQKQQVKEAP